MSLSFVPYVAACNYNQRAEMSVYGEKREDACRFCSSVKG